MSHFDEVINTIIHQSAMLFRLVSAKHRRRAITDRIEQVRGMIELARMVDYPDLAQRLEQHMEVLKQTMSRH